MRPRLSLSFHCRARHGHREAHERRHQDDRNRPPPSRQHSAPPPRLRLLPCPHHRLLPCRSHPRLPRLPRPRRPRRPRLPRRPRRPHDGHGRHDLRRRRRVATAPAKRGTRQRAPRRQATVAPTDGGYNRSGGGNWSSSGRGKRQGEKRFDKNSSGRDGNGRCQ